MYRTDARPLLGQGVGRSELVWRAEKCLGDERDLRRSEESREG